MHSPPAATRIELFVTDRTPRRQLIWTDTSLAAALARRLIEELSQLEPDRLRRCARPQCDLLFYDTTVPHAQMARRRPLRMA